VPRPDLDGLLEHDQHLASAAKGPAIAVRPLQIWVQEGPDSIPVTRDDRCVSPLADVIHDDIMTRGGEPARSPTRRTAGTLGHAPECVCIGTGGPGY